MNPKIWQVCMAGIVVAALRPGPAGAAEVRDDHPRMLFNAADLEWIRERTRTTHKDSWRQAKEWMDQRLTDNPSDNWQSAAIARMMGFVYQVTGDQKYARTGIRYLRQTAAYHLRKANSTGPGNWELTKLRRKNYIAYDWLYDAMSEDERKETGRTLLQVADAHAQKHRWNHAYAGGYNRYENDFYCGIALHKSGVDDTKAAAYIKSGYDFMVKQTITGRNHVASDDGGIQSGMGYAFYNYIPVEAHYLAIWRSATGEDLFDTDGSLKNFPVWTKYTITPSDEAPPICDIGASGKVLTEKILKGVTKVGANGRRLNYSLIASAYKDGRAQAMIPEPGKWWMFDCAHDILWRDPSIKPVADDSALPRGRHFEGLGWVAMRTGWQPEATYSIFTCGDYYYGHKHRDVNHFVIYYKGYLAADARQRIYQSSGHNTLLVYGVGQRDDGDQRHARGDNMYRVKRPIDPACDMGDIVAFETNDHYTYVCGDGAKAYGWRGPGEITSRGKKYVPQLESFTRQYVFLMPRTFVVFDRAVSLKPEAKKIWQLHSWGEPEIAASTFTTRQGQGQLDCWTLIPEGAVIKKDYQKLTGAENTKAELWRVTVEAPRPAKKEQFLHVLHCTDRADPQEATVRKRLAQEQAGVEVAADGFSYTVTFNTEGAVGGHITVKKGNELLLNQELTTKVQPQSGWAVGD